MTMNYDNDNGNDNNNDNDDDNETHLIEHMLYKLYKL